MADAGVDAEAEADQADAAVANPVETASGSAAHDEVMRIRQSTHRQLPENHGT